MLLVLVAVVVSSLLTWPTWIKRQRQFATSRCGCTSCVDLSRWPRVQTGTGSPRGSLGWCVAVLLLCRRTGVTLVRHLTLFRRPPTSNHACEHVGFRALCRLMFSVAHSLTLHRHCPIAPASALTPRPSHSAMNDQSVDARLPHGPLSLSLCPSQVTRPSRTTRLLLPSLVASHRRSSYSDANCSPCAAPTPTRALQATAGLLSSSRP